MTTLVPPAERTPAADPQPELLDVAQDAIVVRDARDRVTFWNAAAERLYGWRRAEALGRVAHEVCRTRFPESRESAMAALRRDGRWEGEVVHVTRDGRELTVSSRWAARRDAAGGIVDVIEASRDVTEQRHTEARLRDSQRLLHQAQQIAGVGSWEWDVAANTLTWSDTLCALFGIAPDAAPSTFDAYLQLIHPEDRDVARAVIGESFDGRRPFAFDHRVLWPDGSVRYVHGRGDVVLAADGTVARMVGSAQDVTERRAAERALRESESRYRTLADSTPAPLWQTDAEGRCTFVNRAWVTLTGRPAESELGVAWRTWVHPADQPRLAASVGAATSARRPFEVEFRIRSADGSWRWLLSVGAPHVAADGAFAGFVGSCVDLTERKEAEAALRASEERYAAIVAQATTGFAEADLDGRFRLVNDRFCEMAGRAREELLGLHVFDITHPDDAADDAARDAPAFARLAATGAPFEMERRYVRPDGSVVWVNHSVSCVRDAHGAVQSVSAVCVDVTARRRAEEALRLLAAAGTALTATLDLRETLAALTGLAVPALADWCTVFLADADGVLRVAASSSARPAKAAAIAGAAERAAAPAAASHPARVAARTGRAVLLTGAPAERQAAAADDPEYGRLVAEMAPASAIAAPLVARDRVLGALMVVTDDPTRAYDEDDVRLVEDLARRAGAAVDNVRLHAAEHAARAAAEASVERTLQLQRVTAALSSAASSEQVARAALDASVGALGGDAGYLALLDPAGAAFHDVHAVGIPPEWLPSWRGTPLADANPLADAARTRSVVVYETADERAARWGSPPPAGLQASVVVPVAVDGHVFGGLSVAFRAPRRIRDDERAFLLAIGQQAALALERARLYEAERVARSEAERANRAKSQFLATMSHELRTPLNAIAGYAELLELGVHGPVTDAQREDLGRIRRSQRHLLGLINQILTHARIETGTVRYELRDVAIADTIASVEALILPQVRAKALDLRMVAPVAPAPPAVALADAERLEQVLLNLVSNAVKFTPRGGVVEVGCDVTGRDVAVWVRDTGIGIPADKLQAVFEPFVQLHGGLTRAHEGTGLGLAISRDLARGMGGDIAVESAPGVGSTFTLRLPRGRVRERGTRGARVRAGGRPPSE